MHVATVQFLLVMITSDSRFWISTRWLPVTRRLLSATPTMRCLPPHVCHTDRCVCYFQDTDTEVLHHQLMSVIHSEVELPFNTDTDTGVYFQVVSFWNRQGGDTLLNVCNIDTMVLDQLVHNTIIKVSYNVCSRLWGVTLRNVCVRCRDVTPGSVCNTDLWHQTLCNKHRGVTMGNICTLLRCSANNYTYAYTRLNTVMLYRMWTICLSSLTCVMLDLY